MKRMLNKKNAGAGGTLFLALAFSFLVFSPVFAQLPPPPDPIPMPTPQNLAGTSVSPTQINLTWSALNSAANPGLLGYKVYRCAGSGCTPTVQIGTVGAGANPSYSNTGLTSGTYGYAVTAYGVEPTFSESAKSATVSVNTQTRTYGLADFVTLVAQWLQTGSGQSADVNTDNVVNTRDLGIMMSYWSAT